MRGGLFFACCVSWLVPEVCFGQATVEPPSAGAELAGPRELHVRLLPPRELMYEHLRVYAREAEADWQLVCEVPCRASVSVGPWELAVGRGDGDPVPVSGRVVDVRGPGTLELAHSTRESVGALGGALLGVGVVVLTTLAIVFGVNGGVGDTSALRPLGEFLYGVGFAGGGLFTLAGIIVLSIAHPVASARWLETME